MGRHLVGYGAKVVDQGTSGGLKWTITYSQKALALFSAKERNAVLRGAWEDAVTRWVNEFLPLRFTDYAETDLGYRITDKYAARKFAYFGWHSRPLIGPPSTHRIRHQHRSGSAVFVNGQRLIEAAQDTRVVATATSTKSEATVKIPTGHPIAAIISAVLHTIPRKEIRFIAERFKEYVAAMVAGADATDPGKLTLSAPQRGAMNVRSRSSPGARAREHNGRFRKAG